MALNTDRFQLPLLASGQAQKEVTHNEALTLADALMHLAVESLDLADPPSSADPGMAYVVAGGATGAWEGQEGKIAAMTAGGWRFLSPRAGTLCLVADRGTFVHFDGSSWVTGGWPVGGLTVGGVQVVGGQAAAVTEPTGGTVIDAELRATVAAILAALRGHGLIAS